MVRPYWFVPWKHIKCKLLVLLHALEAVFDGTQFSDCYSIAPWTLKWSKQIRTRMYVYAIVPLITADVERRSAHADLKDNCLVIANLDDGLDLYNLPNMQLLKSFSHGTMNEYIFKVAFVANDLLVSGGQGGSARVYHVHSGQLLQSLQHNDGEPSSPYLRLICLMFAFSSPDVRWPNSPDCDGKVHALYVLQFLMSFHQSSTAGDSTVIVTASSVIKVWLKTTPATRKDLKTSATVIPSPTNGIALSQLVAILFLTILINLAVTHYHVVTRPCLVLVGKWAMAVARLFEVCTNFFQIDYPVSLIS